MLEFIGFIIKLIFGGLLGAICNYDKDILSNNEVSHLFSGALIGIIGTISTSFALSANPNNLGFLLGLMILASIFLFKTILDQLNIKIGIRELFSLIIGWFVGIGNIFHAIILTIFLIFFLIRFTENRNEDLDDI